MSFFDIFLIIGFIVLVILRVPVCLCMLLTAFCYSLMSGALPISYVTQTMVSSVSSFTMLAVPLFMAVGELMNATGVTEKLFDFADCLVGHIRGGLAHVNILASLFFSGVSGSAAADAAGLGNIEIKAMTEKGFDKEFAVGITADFSAVRTNAGIWDACIYLRRFPVYGRCNNRHYYDGFSDGGGICCYKGKELSGA